MLIPIEVNLKVPSLMVRVAGSGERVRTNNASVRFGKRMMVDAMPVAGAELRLSTRFGDLFDSRVTRADWSDDKNLFVVSCSYGSRSIAEAQYQALLADPDWTKTQLP